MQRRIRSGFLGDAESCADENIAALLDGVTDNTELHRRMLRVMRDIIENELSERQRQMITLYYFEKINIPRISEMLGVNRSTVSRTLSRARRKILEKMRYFF